MPGWGRTTTSGNAFGATDPFLTNAKFVGIETIDVRTGTDSVVNTGTNFTVTNTTTANGVTPTYNLSALDIQNINDSGNASTVTLKLDTNDLFSPTTGSGTNALTALLASSTATDKVYYFYSDAGHTDINANTTRVAILNVHFGA